MTNAMRQAALIATTHLAEVLPGQTDRSLARIFDNGIVVTGDASLEAGAVGYRYTETTRATVLTVNPTWFESLSADARVALLLREVRDYVERAKQEIASAEEATTIYDASDFRPATGRMLH
jgi:hypothetical protein